jgi:hypothetical protein
MASENDMPSKFEKSITPIPIVTVDNVMIPPGIRFVHAEDMTSNMGPQKNPKPLNENNTINNLLIGANVLPGQISPFV